MKEEVKYTIEKIIKQIKAQGFGSVCFWLPTRSVGGGTYLFCELSKYIAENTDLNVYYLDCPDGYAHELIGDNSKIKMIDYESEDFKFPIKEPLIVFTNITRVIQIKKMNPKNKILLWHWETNPVGWGLLFLLNETKRLIKMLNKKNAVVFHDWSSANMLERQSDIRFEEKRYFPVFLPKGEEYFPRTSLIKEDEINIGWVGRLSHDKVFSVLNIIDNFAKYNTSKIKRIHIVGDGLLSEKVREYAKGLYTKIEFVFTGTIPKEDLPNYLRENVDVVFAMGTAALEGASLSMPAVVVQLGEKKFIDDDYYWLYDTKDFCVGVTTEQKKDFDVRYTKFNQILEMVTSTKLEQVGMRSYEFFVENYCGLEGRIKLLLSYMLKTKLTVRKLKRIIKYMPYNQIQVKKYTYRGKNIMQVIKHGKLDKYVLFSRIPFLIRFGKNINKEPVGETKLSKNITKTVKDGYIFTTEKFKG